MLFVIYLSTILCTLVLILHFTTKAKKIAKDDNNASNKNSKLKPVPKFSAIEACVHILLKAKGSILPYARYLGEKYKICQCSFFGISALFINDFEMGKEAFSKTSLAGRPTYALMSLGSHGDYGIIGSRGAKWREQRKFTYQHLKRLGFNTKSMESYIQEEIDDLLQNWKDQKGQVFSPQRSFYVPLLSTIWVILAGERASSRNQKLVDLVCNLYSAVAKATKVPIVFLMGLPIEQHILDKILAVLRYIPGIKNFVKNFDLLHSYLSQEIEEKKKLISSNENPTDLMALYLKEMQEVKDPKSSFYGEEGDKNLLAVMVDFFVAGGDTTAGQLKWCILHLVRNPDVQEKIRKEIEAVVGPGNERRPQLSDRPNCPYTQAFILEAIRFTPFSTTSLPHEATEDTSIGEYFVKKGTMVLLNNQSIHHNPAIWGDPHVFRPERFLSVSSDGVTTCVRHDAICAFSMGWRRCPGEQLAMDNMFLFISAICQRFILNPDPALKGRPKLKELKSLFNSPQTFYMVAVDRFDETKD